MESNKFRTLPKLSDDQKQRVKEVVLAGVNAFDYHDESWTIKRVAAMIRQTFDIEYSRSDVGDLLHKGYKEMHKIRLDEILTRMKADSYSWNNLGRSGETGGLKEAFSDANRRALVYYDDSRAVSKNGTWKTCYRLH